MASGPSQFVNPVWVWPSESLFIEIEDDSGACAEAVVPLIAPFDLLASVFAGDELESDAAEALEVHADAYAGDGVPVGDVVCLGSGAHLAAFPVDERGEVRARGEGVSGAGGDEQTLFAYNDSAHVEAGEVGLEAEVGSEVDCRDDRPAHQAAVADIWAGLEHIVVVHGDGGDGCFAASDGIRGGCGLGLRYRDSRTGPGAGGGGIQGLGKGYGWKTEKQ